MSQVESLLEVALTVNDVITSNRTNGTDSCFIAQRGGATVASINAVGQASFCEGDIILRDEGGGNGALIDVIRAGNCVTRLQRKRYS